MNKKIISLLLFAFLIRLIFLLFVYYNDEQGILSTDSNDYIKLANRIISDFSYKKPEQPEIFRVPGYPFFLAIVIYLFGKHFFVIAFIQIILDTLTCFLLWLLCKKIFIFLGKAQSEKIALCALIFQIITVNAITFSTKILSETLFSVIFIFLLLMIEYINQKTVWKSLFCGVITGILCLIRAVIIPANIIILIYIGFRHKSIKILTVFIIPLTLILGLWSFRNYNKTGYFGISTVPKINLYRYNACAAIAYKNNINFLKQQNICDTNLNKFKFQKKQADFSYKMGLYEFKKDPFTFIFVHLKADINCLFPSVGFMFKMLGFKLGNGTLSVIHSNGFIEGIKYYFKDQEYLVWIMFPFLIIFFAKMFFALLGIYSIGKKYPVTFFYTILILYFILVPGPVATPRFRVPVEGLISIFTALGIISIRH